MYKKRIDLISLKLYRERSIKYAERQITNPKQAKEIVTSFIGNTDREYFGVINLNTKNEPCSIEICTIGLLDHTIVHPREIFKSAILTSAQSILLFHMHPCNSLVPSESDISTTNTLIKASNIIQIPILDHIIITEDGYFSFKEQGLLDNQK